tara:strand:+ start:2216 stop:2884 length:669 start_codon:yes stop_codon:yes gene_type:complete
MKIENAYLQFLNLVNRNMTNNKVNVDKPRFIILYNDVANKYVEWILEKRNEDAIRYVAPLLVPNKKLSNRRSKHTYDEFALPDDYFDLANLHIHAGGKSCGGVELKAWEIKAEDVEEKYNDKFQEPSLPWRDTFYHTADNKVLVYKKDFSIQEAFLSYYRYPVQVDIIGYTHIDGTPSQSVHPELGDKVIGRILLAMSKEFSAINGDSQGYQVDNARLFSAI